MISASRVISSWFSLFAKVPILGFPRCFQKRLYFLHLLCRIRYAIICDAFYSKRRQISLHIDQARSEYSLCNQHAQWEANYKHQSFYTQTAKRVATTLSLVNWPYCCICYALTHLYFQPPKLHILKWQRILTRLV